MNQATRYRALDMLTSSCVPMLAKRPPYWRPSMAEPENRVWVPAWSWRAPIAIEDRPGQVTVLDSNANYLSAISTVEVAHGGLQHTGCIPFDPSLPGYWQMRRYPWQDPRIMSPLGTGGGRSDMVWLTTPTVQLLSQLAADGYWPDVDVIDSWTSPTRCRLRRWSDRIRSDRAAAIGHQNEPWLGQIKLGYSQAVTIMADGSLDKVHRPDWARHIRAQAAASVWRRGWSLVLAGRPLIGAGRIDELVLDRPTACQLWSRRAARPAPPIVLDHESYSLGTFKAKGSLTYAEWAKGSVRRG